jgi:hypothetical protein
MHDKYAIRPLSTPSWVRRQPREPDACSTKCLRLCQRGLHTFLAETINGLYKAEVIHRRRPWCSFEAVEFATLEWVNWFSNRRLLEPIGNVPPAEAKELFYASMKEVRLAA